MSTTTIDKTHFYYGVIYQADEYDPGIEKPSILSVDFLTMSNYNDLSNRISKTLLN